MKNKKKYFPFFIRIKSCPRFSTYDLTFLHTVLSIFVSPHSTHARFEASTMSSIAANIKLMHSPTTSELRAMRKMKLKILWWFFMFGNFLERISWFFSIRGYFFLLYCKTLWTGESFWAFYDVNVKNTIFFMFYKFPTPSTDVFKNLKFRLHFQLCLLLVLFWLEVFW